MQVIVNPYHRSVTIDGVEVVQKILDFPNELNHLSTISCTYDSSKKKITDVHDLHRFTSNYIEREYFFTTLPVFVDWYYREKQAQVEEAARQQKYKQDVENAITQTVNAGLTAQANIKADKDAALTSITTAKNSATSDITSRRTEAVSAIQTNKIETLNAITDTTNSSVSSVTGAMNTALNNIATDRASAVNAIANDKANALEAIATDRRTSLEEINTSINKAIAQADRSKNEADRAKNYADAIESINEVRPATKEKIGLVIVGDNINVNERGVIDVPLSSKATQDEEGNEVPEVAGVVTTDDTLVNNNGKIGVNEALYLKLAGGKLTGNLTITKSLFYSNEAVIKGQNPSTNVGWNFFINDKDEFVSTQENSLGRINTTLYSNGNVRTSISAYQNTKDLSNDCTISVNTRQDGTTFTSAPTPPILDSSNQIATTEWVLNKFGKLANVNIYVEKTGNDSNDGLTANKPVLTLAAAINRARQFRNPGWVISIHIGEGKWIEHTNLLDMGYIEIQGAGKNKTIIETPNNDTNNLFNIAKSRITFKNLTINCNAAFGIYAQDGSRVNITDVDFNLSSSSALYSSTYSVVVLLGTTIFTGTNAVRALYADDGGRIIQNKSTTITFKGAFTSATVECRNQSWIDFRNTASISGNVTGKRYAIEDYGVIKTRTANENLIPGSIAGTKSYGGIYY